MAAAMSDSQCFNQQLVAPAIEPPASTVTELTTSWTGPNDTHNESDSRDNIQHDNRDNEDPDSDINHGQIDAVTGTDLDNDSHVNTNLDNNEAKQSLSHGWGEWQEWRTSGHIMWNIVNYSGGTYWDCLNNRGGMWYWHNPGVDFEANDAAQENADYERYYYELDDDDNNNGEDSETQTVTMTRTVLLATMTTTDPDTDHANNHSDNCPNSLSASAGSSESFIVIGANPTASTLMRSNVECNNQGRDSDADEEESV